MTRFNVDPSLDLAAARDLYFQVNNFGPNGGYDDAWVDFKLGPIPMPFPNTPGRVAAVKFHDLHHVLTGYDTDTLGEFEISAWELGGGCGKFHVAWQLNLGGTFAGLLTSPRRTWRAFVRGRRSGTLYAQQYDALLTRKVGDVQTELGLTQEPEATATDALLFAGALVAGALVGLVTTALVLPLAVWANGNAALRRKPVAKVAQDS